jgi:hypothetical protein
MAFDHPTTLTDGELERRQLAGLMLDGQATIQNEPDAVRFMRSVGFALRYDATPGLPLAAMFRAAGEKRRAIELTNMLLARAEAIETNVIAGRLVLLHPDVVPAVYALRKRNCAAELSSNAKRALELIRRDGHATSGDVRRHLGVAGLKRPDPGDLALEELQQEMLIDRGPSSVPKKGIPYLSPEGFPYRIFEKAHPGLVRAGKRMKAADAICSVIETYLRAAVFVTPRKLASMFKLLFSESEMHEAIAALVQANKTLPTRNYVLYVPMKGD